MASPSRHPASPAGGCLGASVPALAEENLSEEALFEQLKSIEITQDVVTNKSQGGGMNDIMNGHLDRMENAIDNLIESITSYNPSIAAAHEVVAADDALTEGLALLVRHQANYRRILELRAENATFDEETKSIVQLLSDTRQAILTTPVTTFTTQQRAVPVKELLNYARNISPYTTVPLEIRVAHQRHQELLKRQNVAQQSTQLLKTPAQDRVINGAPDPTQQVNAMEITDQKTRSEGIGVSNLTEADYMVMGSFSRISFLPWPSEERIRAGSLAHIQKMPERGEDPQLQEVTRGSEDTKIEEAGTRDVFRTIEGAVVESRRGNSIAMASVTGRVKEEKPQIFDGFDLYDPDEDGQ